MGAGGDCRKMSSPGQVSGVFIFIPGQVSGVFIFILLFVSKLLGTSFLSNIQNYVMKVLFRNALDDTKRKKKNKIYLFKKLFI